MLVTLSLDGRGLPVTVVLTSGVPVDALTAGSPNGVPVTLVANGIPVQVVSGSLNSYTFARMVLEGDSHTAGGYYYSGAWLALRSWTAASDGDPATVTAVGGSGIDTVESRLASVIALNPSLVTLWIGANDLYQFTASAYYARCIAYFASIRASVPGCKFGFAEVLPLDPNNATNAPPAKATHNAKRAALAALQRAGVGTDFDFIIPVGSAPIFTNAAGADTNIFPDGLHPDGAARPVMVSVYEASVAPVIANNFTGTTPTFTTNNVTNASTSTDYYIDFLVTGLGAGRSVTFSKTGGSGTIARGNQDVGTAFGTSSVQLMNGDYGRVKITSSGVADTPVTMDINVGGVTRTISVRTAAAPANTMIMNAADKTASLVVSGGGLTVSQATDPQTPNLVRSTIPFTGKRYAEMTVNSRQGVFFPQFGVCNSTASLTATPGDGNANGGGTTPFGGINPGPYTAYGSGLAPGDVVMLAFDTATHKLWMGKNGVWANTTDPATGVNGTDVGALANYYLFVELQRIDNVTVNTGGSAFAYTPPSGFTAMP